MGVNGYRELKVWQEGVQLALEIYRLSEAFPKSEIYGLTSQMRRAAVSISANIAEGAARDTTKEYLRFVSIAIGSAAELQTLMQIVRGLKYLNESQLSPIESTCESITRMLRALQRSLRQRMNRTNGDS